MFHKQGIPTLIVTFIFCAILSSLSLRYAPAWVFNLSILLAVFLLVTVLQFFRNPSRKKHPEDGQLIYTPADGKVVVIEKTYEPEYLKEECWQVSVFMSPINVHINRIPVSGTVEYLKYHKGTYLAAWNPKASTENERFTTVYNTPNGKVLIRQIAGALARRIVNNLQEKESVTQSEEMGFIKFGSRVDIFLPLSAKIKVEIDQKVKSPLDVIAEF